MNFAVNYEAAQNLVAPGTYECRIAEAFTNVTSGGTLYFSVRMAIRDDVEQPHRGRIIFHKIWRKREPTAEDMTVDGFSFKQLMALCRAAQLPNGKNYASLDDLGNDLEGRDVKVTVEHAFNDYRGETEVRVKWINKSDLSAPTAQTSAPNPPVQTWQHPKGSVPDLVNEDGNPVEDDDLPF